MKLCISTLACPAWTFQQILDGCSSAGINGIDFRGIASEIDITRIPQFTTELPDTLQQLNQRNLRMPCLNLSTTLVTTDEARWQGFLEETQRAAQLGQQTQTRFLRVFGGGVPKEISRTEARDLARRHLRQIIKIAAVNDCLPVLETHDDWATSDEVLEIIADFSPEEVGVLWDIEHPFRKGEPPARTAERLADYVRHVHIKDSNRIDGKNIPTLLGDGELAIDENIAALKSIHYNGWYSLETEKRWRSEAPEPEVSLPQFVEFMRARI